MVIGRVYRERGQPVTILARWGPPGGMIEPCYLDFGVDLRWHLPHRPVAPRNVLVEREDGTRVVRPFRGLRKVP